jgi:hypothetical protein
MVFGEKKKLTKTAERIWSLDDDFLRECGRWKNLGEI